MSPKEEAAIYDAATTRKPILETTESVLPVSGLGMAARKRALRERRAIGPGEVARLRANAAATKKREDDEVAHQAAESEAEGVRIAQAEEDAKAAEEAAATELAAQAKAAEEAAAAELVTQEAARLELEAKVAAQAEADAEAARIAEADGSPNLDLDIKAAEEATVPIPPAQVGDLAPEPTGDGAEEFLE